MPIDFFDTEVRKVKDRFNETFGQLEACDIRTREAVILSIISLDRLSKKIKMSKDKSLIQRFMRTRTALNGVFDPIEHELNERRKYGSSGDGHQRQTNDGNGNSGRVSNHLQELREHLPQHLAKSG